MGDHTETVRVEFNPEEISYSALLEVFWAGHDPGRNTSYRQYRNAIFALNAEQRQQAEISRQQVATRIGGPVRTDIETVERFYPAEDYHQKYYLRQAGSVLAEFKVIYPDEKQLAASTAVARVNGYLGCNGSVEQLTAEIGSFGLSPNAQQQLANKLTSACKSFRGFTCPAPQ